MINASFRSDLDGLYRRNHREQTLEKAGQLRARWSQRRLGRATVWDRLMSLAEVNDESDADLESMSQLGHALQTANSVVDAGLGEDWIITALVHDLGKILLQQGEPQEFVVGDIFPLGCAYSENIIRHEYLRENPDWKNPDYQSRCGIYDEHCGLDEVVFSYGHDEYGYEVFRDRLPREYAWTIRYHSFQSIAGDYLHLFSDEDLRLREAMMKPFARHDLYTKNPRVVVERRLADYRDLITRRFPDPIDW